MTLVNCVESCEEMGHPQTKAYLVYHPMVGGQFQSDCYCHDCEKPFTRPATPEEIGEFKRIQSIPLIEYKH